MAVGWYVWILTLFPVTIRESLTLLDCTMQSNGKRTLDIDPAVTCDDIYMTLFGIGCFLFYLLGFIFTIVLFRCLSFGDFKWIDQQQCLNFHLNDEPCYECAHCDKRQKFHWLFTKYHLKYYHWEITGIVSRKILMALPSLFLSTRKYLASLALIFINLFYVTMTVIYQPYLTDEEDEEQRRMKSRVEDLNKKLPRCSKKRCGVNVGLDVLLMIAEICLAISSMITARLILDLQSKKKNYSENMLASTFPTETIVIGIFEWGGFILFACGLLFCLKETITGIVLSQLEKKRKAKAQKEKEKQLGLTGNNYENKLTKVFPSGPLHDKELENMFEDDAIHRQLSTVRMQKQSDKANQRLKRRLAKREEKAKAVLNHSKTITKIKCFEHMKEDAVAAFLNRMKFHIYKDKKLICEAHAPAHSFYVIVSGNVRILVPIDNEMTEVRQLGPLSSFGEMSLVDDNVKRTASVVAVGQVEALTFTNVDFKELRQIGIIDSKTENILKEQAKTHKENDLKRKIATRMRSVRERSTVKAKNKFIKMLFRSQAKKTRNQLHNDSDDFAIEIGREVEHLVGTSEIEHAKRRDSIKKAKSNTHDALLWRLERRKQQQKIYMKKMIDEHEDKLKKIKCFKNLPRDDFNRVLGAFFVQEFEDNDIVCKNGDVADNFYVILHGHIAVYGNINLNNMLREMGSIDEEHSDSQPYFGETALLKNNGKRTATCVAKCAKDEKVILMGLSRHRFETCIRHSKSNNEDGNNSFHHGIREELTYTFDSYNFT